MDHLELLKSLVSKWSGTGRGEYPTIEPFEYLETLRFCADDRAFVHYEQVTRRRNIGTEIYTPSHWENGFIHLLEDGTIRVNNAQSGGRVEVLDGTLEQIQNGFILRLQSTSFLNDPRMLETSRVITLEGDTLHYTTHMRTNTVPEMAIHLDSKLQKLK
jgi:hypothetical protein